MNLRSFNSKMALAAIGATFAAVTLVTTVFAAYPSGDQVDAWAAGQDLRVAGSTTAYPILAQALNISVTGGTSTTSPFQAYANPSGTIKAQLFQGGSGHGRAAVNTNDGGFANGQDANVGMSSSGTNALCVQDPIARDGVCMVVNNTGNVLGGIQGLTLAQIKGIYEGTITNWNQIPGGPTLAIFPIARFIGSGTRDAIVSFASITDATEQGYFGSNNAGPYPHGIRIDSSADVVTAIQNDGAGAIGYLGVGYADGMSSPELVLPVASNSTPTNFVPANAMTVTANTYPMSRFLWLIEGTGSYGTATCQGAYAKSLVTYLATTDAGQSTVANQGFVMLKPRQDVDGNGTVNIVDVVKIGLSWNTKSTDAGYNLACDVNRDGKVNISDVVSVGLWWNITAQAVPANQW